MKSWSSRGDHHFLSGIVPSCDFSNCNYLQPLRWLTLVMAKGELICDHFLDAVSGDSELGIGLSLKLSP